MMDISYQLKKMRREKRNEKKITNTHTNYDLTKTMKSNQYKNTISVFIFLHSNELVQVFDN